MLLDMIPAKTAELIKMLYGLQTHVSKKLYVRLGYTVAPSDEHDCVVAMWHCVTYIHTYTQIYIVPKIMRTNLRHITLITCFCTIVDCLSCLVCRAQQWNVRQVRGSVQRSRQH